MRYSLLFLACCTIIANSGCREKKKEDPRPVSTEIFGEWQWVSSIGGFTGKQVSTPASTGINLLYRFNRDSTFVQCNNGQCSKVEKFSTRMERSYVLGVQRLILTIPRRIYLAPPDTGYHVLRDRYLIQEVSNNLVIDQDGPDGIEMVFSRK